jgi:hypothetical protein
MPRSKSTSRKYFKRKLIKLPNKELPPPDTEFTQPDTEITLPNPEITLSTHANIPQSDPIQSKISSFPTTSTKKQDKNKKKRLKYKLKLKENKNKKPRKSYKTLYSKKLWFKEVKSSKNLKINQKKKLIKIHNLEKIQEYNYTLLCNQQLSIHKETYKDSEANSTTSFSTNPRDQSATTILDNIKLIKEDIANLNKKIENIKNTEITAVRNKINELKNKSPQKRFIKQRINKINNNLTLFQHLINNRKYITKTGYSNRLKEEETSRRKTTVIQEQIKLKSSNKIHNFTNLQLPKDITDVLNKGTNFIPTATNLNPTNLKSSIRSEVNTALNNIITKHPCNLKMKNSKPAKIFKRTHPCRRKINPTTLLQQEQSRPNFNFNLIEYVHETHSYIQRNIYLKLILIFLIPT